MPLARFVRRHPHTAFLLLFSTLGQAVAFVPVVARRVYGVEWDPDLFLIVPTMLFLLMPTLLITQAAWGRDGLRALVRDVLRFRVPPTWYLLPLLVVPVGAAATTLSLPDGAVAATYVTAWLPALAMQFLTTNWWEEMVWAGFFQAPLQERFGPMRAVLIATPFFALQHAALAFADRTVADGLVYLLILTVAVVPVRAFLAWVYNRTGSLAVVGLTHAALNAGVALAPLFAGPVDGVLPLVVLGLVVMAATRGRLGLPRSVDTPRRGAFAERHRVAAVAGAAPVPV